MASWPAARIRHCQFDRSVSALHVPPRWPGSGDQTPDEYHYDSARKEELSNPIQATSRPIFRRLAKIEANRTEPEQPDDDKGQHGRCRVLTKSAESGTQQAKDTDECGQKVLRQTQSAAQSKLLHIRRPPATSHSPRIPDAAASAWLMPVAPPDSGASVRSGRVGSLGS